MKPPYRITHTSLKLLTSISKKLGEVKANYLSKLSPQLRKKNKILTIHSSLKIEGNTLTKEEVTAIIDNKRVVGPQKDILEVVNAIRVYDSLKEFNPASLKSYLKAHGILMTGLIENAGKLRNQEVGIYEGEQVKHVAPPAKMVGSLMSDLFDYLSSEDELTIIKSCVFHYETEFIHPFIDGNGRMGRLWQTVILLKEFPVFEFLPFETLISQKQKEYYEVLANCDKNGESTEFIEYMLQIIDYSLKDILNSANRTLTEKERLEYFLGLGLIEFSRSDYMNIFKNISTATASRDLRKGVELNYFQKTGDKSNTIYKI